MKNLTDAINKAIVATGSLAISASVSATELVPTDAVQTAVSSGLESILSVAAIIMPGVVTLLVIGWIVSAVGVGRRA